MFALAAIPGSLLIARFGVLGVATLRALRSWRSPARPRAVAIDVWTLYAATLLMGFGVAIFQPAFPTLVRLWAPNARLARQCGLHQWHADGRDIRLGAEHSRCAALLGQSWRLDLLAWSVPGILITALYIVAAPRRPHR